MCMCVRARARALVGVCVCVCVCTDCDPGDKVGCAPGLVCGVNNCGDFHLIGWDTGILENADCCEGKLVRQATFRVHLIFILLILLVSIRNDLIIAIDICIRFVCVSYLIHA